MLHNRGYVILDKDIHATIDDFESEFGPSPSRESLTIQVFKQDNQQDQIFVFFPVDEKVGVKPLKTYCERMKANSVFNAIIIFKVNMTPFARSAVKELMTRGYRMECFKVSESFFIHSP